MLVLQFPPLSILLLSTPTMDQLSQLFWPFYFFYCCVCSDCSWFGFGFRFFFGVWAWAPEKVLRPFSTVHCFVLLCRTGLLELSSACICICISEHVSVPVPVPLPVSMLSLLLFVGTENWFPVSAQSQLHRWLYTLCPILSTLGVLIFPETITKYEGVRRDYVPFRSAHKRLRLRQCQKRPHRDASSKFSHALCVRSSPNKS